MRFYDTLSRSVDEFSPLEAGRVTMYTCGPTVYRHAHIGNLRTYITADLLRRTLEFEGLDVKQVTNITDVGHMTDEVNEAGEDRMLMAAEDEGLSPQEIASKYTDIFLRHLEAVNVRPSALYPRATDHIEEMTEIIVHLIERGHAYEVEGTVYFDVDTFPNYGSLSRNTTGNIEAAHRLEAVDPHKRRHYDFTLWRAAGERRLMKWDSPWGPGYPGWHIECSAMSIKHLGERFDIHTGGSDNIFPHHECEIAQSEGAVGHRVVGRWLHGHHLLAEGRRMAKSAGNYFTIDDLIERGYDPLSMRFLVLQTRYRSQENFTFEALDAAQRGLARLRTQMAEWAGPASFQPSEDIHKLDVRFRRAVDADLDTPQALAVLSELAGARIDPSAKFELAAGWDSVLGLDLARDAATAAELPSGAEDLIRVREKARAAGDYDAADRAREELSALGVEVFDTPRGPRWTVSRRVGS